MVWVAEIICDLVDVFLLPTSPMHHHWCHHHSLWNWESDSRSARIAWGQWLERDIFLLWLWDWRLYEFFAFMLTMGNPYKSTTHTHTFHRKYHKQLMIYHQILGLTVVALIVMWKSTKPALALLPQTWRVAVGMAIIAQPSQLFNNKLDRSTTEVPGKKTYV